MASYGPEIQVKASEEGLHRLIITHDRGDKTAGVAVLQRIFPALLQLDRLARGACGARSGVM
jgi:hypothetical protein